LTSPSLAARTPSPKRSSSPTNSWHLRRPDTTRLLCVVSDGYLTDRDAAQTLLSTLHHTGCRTLWLEPAGHSAPPFADTTTLALTDPAVAITAIANAACGALTADMAQQVHGS
jgi:hypothetical protein